MSEGYIKLWRKSINSGLLSNPALWTFWCWCLLKASHKETTHLVGMKRVKLLPGQFVFGRSKAASALELSESKIFRMLSFLKSEQMVDIQANNKFSIITIVNWDTYQGENCDCEQQNEQQVKQQTNNKRTASEQQTNTNKNVKNVKNNTPQTPQGAVGGSKPDLPDWIDPEAWKAWSEFRKKIKAPLTDRAIRLHIATLSKLKAEGSDPTKVIDQSIERGWRGLFPVKGDSKGYDYDRELALQRELDGMVQC